MLGSCAKNYPKTVRRAYEEGHQICSHSYDHPTLTTQSDTQIYNQMNKTKNILDDALGMNFTYHVRPPYGDVNARVRGILGNQFHAASIIWSVDPLDWQDRNATTVANRIVSKSYNGAIVLCHDIYSTTVTGVLNAIDTLKSYGYEFVTLNELFRRRGKTLNPGSSYADCKKTDREYGPMLKPTISEKDVNGKKYAVMESNYSEAKIYYTLDGSNPIYSKKVYKEPIEIQPGTKIRAVVAYTLNGSRSEETTYTASNTIEHILTAPTAESKYGLIFLRTTESNVRIRYSTDNTEVTAKSTLYTDALEPFDGVIRARVYRGESYSPEFCVYVSKNANLFTDVPYDAWYAESIDRSVTLGLFNGVGPLVFEPESKLTRGMFVTVLYRLMEAHAADMAVKAPASFPDLTQDWYKEAVAWASEKGIVNGYTDGTFGPDREISREEMSTILGRTLNWYGKKLPKGELSFTDAEITNLWAKDYIASITELGILKGYTDGSFGPLNTATRGEAATVLLRTWDYLRQEPEEADVWSRIIRFITGQ